MHADNAVCPTPQTIAQTGVICRLEARCTNAMAELVTTPLVVGASTPITRISIEKKRPNLCLRSVTKANIAAQVCTNIDENMAHMKT